MANTYSWTIKQLAYEIGPDAEGHRDVVYIVDWLLTASDEEDPPHNALRSGITQVTREGASGWIPYEELTEAVVVGWVEEDRGEDELADMKSKLDAQIAEGVAPTRKTSRTMPWEL
tara:strand:+ start:573 stop:920 length:348 start_codon:yes stop_codon:yes gene_type:complete